MNTSSKTFSTSRNNQTNTTSSGGRNQSNAFDSDFKRIDAMYAKGEYNYGAVGKALDSLRVRARNLRDAVAMRKIADYYDKIYAYHSASLSREEAKTF